MRRLVYSPSVHAYIKADDGVVDVSPWIVSGSVNRKINQVSVAQLTLRNPIKDDGPSLLWTDHTRADGKIGPRFHPMDPIIIVMTRLTGRPVQVFTGYVDKAPYLQFYPGLCTIEASCTLKRLLYTQWDAALPFMQNFLAEYGWIANPDTGAVNFNTETAKLKAVAGQLQGQFNDGSIGALLFAVLNVIGTWEGDNIWIEALPPQIKDMVTNLYKDIEANTKDDVGRFEELINQIIGSQAIGTAAPTANPASSTSPSLAGGGTVGSPLLNHNQQAFGSAFSQTTGLDPNVVATWLISEEPASAAQAPNGANNWLNIGATDSGFYGAGNPAWRDPASAGTFSAQWVAGTAAPGFGRAAPGIRAILQTAGQSAQAQIAAIQHSGWASSGYPSFPSVYAQIVAAGGNAASSASAPSQRHHGLFQPATGIAPAAEAFSSTVQSNTQRQGSTPGGRTGGSGGSTTPRFPLTAGTYVDSSRWSPDQGVDIATNGGACGRAAPLLAMGAGTVVAHGISGFGPSAPVLKLDSPIGGQNYIYYGHADPALLAAIGTHLNAGQVIGSVGCGIVGISTGPHLEIGFSDANGTPVPGTSSLMLQTLHSAQTGAAVPGSPTSGSAAGTTTPSGGGVSARDAVAAAFASMINLPSTFNQTEALFFTGRRSFIADQPLFPFVQQLCQASMRSFMSMPNGNFFAFFPDYFGLFGRRYYWEIEDIELIDGRIDLSDDSLATHVAITGDTTQYHAQVDFFDRLQTSGIFTIFDGFTTGYLSKLQNRNAKTDQTWSVQQHPGDKTASKARAEVNPADKRTALAFLKKYGARPLAEEVPAIRSPFFELFYAFQKFMLMWAKQFQTTFEFTFMPELFPGGIVAFPNHHLQCYIEEVVHHWDYTQGFTTTVSLSAPSVIASDPESRPTLSEGIMRPLQ